MVWDIPINIYYMILKYFKFFESRRTVFTDYKSSVNMSDDEYRDLLNSEYMKLEDFNTLKKRLETISKIIGFNFEFSSNVVQDDYYKYSIKVDYNLLSVKSSFLDIISRLSINKDINNNSLYFSYNETTYLKTKSFYISSKLFGLSSTPDAKVISTNSINVAYKEIMNDILQTIVSCKDEFGLLPSNIELNIPDLKIILISLIGTNMSISKTPTLNKPVKDYLNDKISHSIKAHNILHKLQIENPILYKLYTGNKNKKDYKDSSKLNDMGFSD